MWSVTIWQATSAALLVVVLVLAVEMRRLYGVHRTLTYNLEATIKKYFDLYENEQELRKAYQAQNRDLRIKNDNLTQHNNALYSALAPPDRHS